ncbi:hypothetical protein PMI15_02568 [Polaromonas sp. CF318]|nr:hypothetical protein [Polaromonas sp. CF318]EJL83555.1 hypothetical protein PMI15_02568 [Polaromonas sp. CF318]
MAQRQLTVALTLQAPIPLPGAAGMGAALDRIKLRHFTAVTEC